MSRSYFESVSVKKQYTSFSWLIKHKKLLKIVCSYYVKCAFQSESTLYSCLDVQELLARNRRHIWSSSDCNGTRTPNHLVRKRTLNYLGKLASLAKWLSVPFEDYIKRKRLVPWTIWIHLLLLIINYSEIRVSFSFQRDFSKKSCWV